MFTRQVSVLSFGMRDIDGFLYLEFTATRPGWMRSPLRISVPSSDDPDAAEVHFHITYAPYLIPGKTYTAILDTERGETRVRLGNHEEVSAWMLARRQ